MKGERAGHRFGKVGLPGNGVDERGTPKCVKRLRAHRCPASSPSCHRAIGMEACGSAHYWARKFQGYGHEVRLISPQFVGRM